MQHDFRAAVAELGMVGVAADVVPEFPAADAFFHAVVFGARDGDGFLAVGGRDHQLGNHEDFVQLRRVDRAFIEGLPRLDLHARLKALADLLVAALSFQLKINLISKAQHP